MPSSHRPGSRVLIVEDDLLLRDAFRMLLEDAGYRVGEAGTAEEALAAVAEEAPALLLLDLGLPDRPGLDVARSLHGRPETSGIPIIALTGRVGADEKRACLAAGCALYFSKPVRPRELLRSIERLIAR